MTTFGDRLQIIRERDGITWAELADRCAVHPHTVESWVYEGREPHLGIARRVADGLGYTVDELVDPLLELPPAPTRKPRRQEGVLPDPTAWASSFAAAVEGRNMVALAEDTGLARSTLHAYKRGEWEDPTVSRALLLARFLGLTLDGMCSGRE